MLGYCGEAKQEIVAGMDVGSRTIGVAAVVKNGEEVKELFKEEVILRGDDVKRKIQQRQMYRRTRRRRKLRYRQKRHLNRGKKGSIRPSVLHSINCHLKEKKYIESLLPITKWIVETAKFDINKISNPNIIDYKDGPQKGYNNIKAYILDRDGYKCRLCGSKNKKFHIHHINLRSKGGSNEHTNLITICEDCHDKIHKGKVENFKVRRSITKDASQLNVISPQVIKRFNGVLLTYGFETKYKREAMGLPKTHYNDALSICLSDEEAQLNNIKLLDYYCVKKMVSKGDYRQTRGRHSQTKIPTGKLFGLRKFDKVKTIKGIGFVSGKRKDGRFAICDVFGNSISENVNIKKNVIRISARKNYLFDIIKIER